MLSSSVICAMLSPLSDISASDVSSWVGFFFFFFLSFPMMKRLYDPSSVLSAHRGAQQGNTLVSGFPTSSVRDTQKIYPYTQEAARLVHLAAAF